MCSVAQSCPTLCDTTDCPPPGSSFHGDSPGKNTGVGCHDLLQGIFPTQRSNPGLLHCRQILYQLSHQGMTPWTVACQFPLFMGSSRQEYWSVLPFSTPGDLPDPGIEPNLLCLLHWKDGSGCGSCSGPGTGSRTSNSQTRTPGEHRLDNHSWIKELLWKSRSPVEKSQPIVRTKNLRLDKLKKVKGTAWVCHIIPASTPTRLHSSVPREWFSVCDFS